MAMAWPGPVTLWLVPRHKSVDVVVQNYLQKKGYLFHQDTSGGPKGVDLYNIVERLYCDKWDPICPMSSCSNHDKGGGLFVAKGDQIWLP